MNTAQAITIGAASLLLLASHRAALANVEGDGLGTFTPGAVLDRAETFYNVLTEQGANVTDAQASRNLGAFLRMLRQSEGTSNAADPYRVCYGYGHTISDLSDHPAVTGEWHGKPLSDAMCRNAGFGPGCVSSAAGAYQIIRGTWLSLRDALGLEDFGPLSQDLAAIELVRRRGALADAQGGRLEAAVRKCRNEWASLPGNGAGQGQRSIQQLAQWYSGAGGGLA